MPGIACQPAPARPIQAVRKAAQYYQPSRKRPGNSLQFELHPGSRTYPKIPVILIGTRPAHAEQPQLAFEHYAGRLPASRPELWADVALAKAYSLQRAAARPVFCNAPVENC